MGSHVPGLNAPTETEPGAISLGSPEVYISEMAPRL